MAACTQDNEWLDEQAESAEATVHLNLQSAEMSVDTRSTTPQDPQTDNPMYHLYLLHYNNEGQLIRNDSQGLNLGNPQLTYQWNPTLRIVPDAIETICLVANMENAGQMEWPDNLAALKEACATLQIDDNGLIAEKKMYMFGYYEGTITKNQSINIMMGRMATALKFVISCPNGGNKRYRITKIEIKNTSRETYYYPHNSTERNFGSNIIETFYEYDDNNTIGNGLQQERNYYYQVGENIAPNSNRRTTVIITAQKGSYSYYYGWQYANAKTYTVVLGADAPGTPNRNYSLHRNNNYTFNIELK